MDQKEAYVFDPFSQVGNGISGKVCSSRYWEEALKTMKNVRQDLIKNSHPGTWCNGMVQWDGTGICKQPGMTLHQPHPQL